MSFTSLCSALCALATKSATTDTRVATDADLTIIPQRPVDRQSVQRPAPPGPAATRQHTISSALSQAQVTLPQAALASLPNVSAGLTKHFWDSKHIASMAETITTVHPTTVGDKRKVYDAMRFVPGQVSLDGHDCINSVVDTEA